MEGSALISTQLHSSHQPERAEVSVQHDMVFPVSSDLRNLLHPRQEILCLTHCRLAKQKASVTACELGFFSAQPTMDAPRIAAACLLFKLIPTLISWRASDPVGQSFGPEESSHFSAWCKKPCTNCF